LARTDLLLTSPPCGATTRAVDMPCASRSASRVGSWPPKRPTRLKAGAGARAAEIPARCSSASADSIVSSSEKAGAGAVTTEVAGVRAGVVVPGELEGAADRTGVAVTAFGAVGFEESGCDSGPLFRSCERATWCGASGEGAESEKPSRGRTRRAAWQAAFYAMRQQRHYTNTRTVTRRTCAMRGSFRLARLDWLGVLAADGWWSCVPAPAEDAAGEGCTADVAGVGTVALPAAAAVPVMASKKSVG